LGNVNTHKDSAPWHITAVALLCATIGYVCISVLVGDHRAALFTKYLPWLIDRRVAWAGIALTVALFLVVVRLTISGKSAEDPSP
jgi:hypothetical protein